LAAALRLIDADGVEALSMRKLAANLQVNPMSLYHHVANKATLLADVTRMVSARIEETVPTNGPWQQQLRRLADDFRALSLAHRNLMRYAFAGPNVIQRDGPMWLALCRVLRASGLPERDIEPIGAVLASLVCGLLLTELNGTRRRLSALDGTEADDAAGFSLAVQMLIDGVAARIAAP
jgi:AcrR family transcriptional regulator